MEGKLHNKLGRNLRGMRLIYWQELKKNEYGLPLYFSSTFHAWAVSKRQMCLNMFCQADRQLIIKEHRSARIGAACNLLQGNEKT